jgi:hypothetical protein
MLTYVLRELMIIRFYVHEVMLSRIFKRRGYLALAPHHGNLAAVPAAFQ